ncbi:MAG: ureidoglycolate lyase [Pseudomonadota bacterium]
MIQAQQLEPGAFARFGSVIRSDGTLRWINEGRCARYHALAEVDTAGPAGISLFRSEPVPDPVEIDLMERHPLGSQAFLPLSRAPFLVVVAEDVGGAPGALQAFVTAPGEGVSYARNIWHAVLMPLGAPQDFAVVDYVGDERNLEEHRLNAPVAVALTR